MHGHTFRQLEKWNPVYHPVIDENKLWQYWIESNARIEINTKCVYFWYLLINIYEYISREYGWCWDRKYWKWDIDTNVPTFSIQQTVYSFNIFHKNDTILYTIYRILCRKTEGTRYNDTRCLPSQLFLTHILYTHTHAHTPKFPNKRKIKRKSKENHVEYFECQTELYAYAEPRMLGSLKHTEIVPSNVTIRAETIKIIFELFFFFISFIFFFFCRSFQLGFRSPNVCMFTLLIWLCMLCYDEANECNKLLNKVVDAYTIFSTGEQPYIYVRYISPPGKFVGLLTVFWQIQFFHWVTRTHTTHPQRKAEMHSYFNSI